MIKKKNASKYFLVVSKTDCDNKDNLAIGVKWAIILASVSFWPLLIIELVPRSVPARLIIR